MSAWKRSTKEISFEQLPSEMKADIQKLIELYNLGDILSDAHMHIQTDFEKAKKGLFGSVEVVHMGAVVTPRWSIWVLNGTKTSIAVLSAVLTHLVVQDYADTSFAKMVPDSGIEVSGTFTDTAENASAFLGLQDNAAGKKFKETVIQRCAKCKEIKRTGFRMEACSSILPRRRTSTIRSSQDRSKTLRPVPSPNLPCMLSWNQSQI